MKGDLNEVIDECDECDDSSKSDDEEEPKKTKKNTKKTTIKESSPFYKHFKEIYEEILATLAKLI